MLRYILLIPIVFILGFLAIISMSDGIAIFAFTLLLLALLSLVYLFCIKKKVQIRIDIPTKTAEKGQSFTLRIRVNKRTILPLGRLEMTVRCMHGSRPYGGERKVRLGKNPTGESTHMVRLTMEESGFYEFCLKGIRLYDPLGLFYMHLKNMEKANVLIMPSIEEVPVMLGEGVKRFYGESSYYDDQRAGNDPSETFEIREYREGDKLQRVHWKISARTDELMVKESSLPKACPIVLFMPDEERATSKSLDYLTSLSFTLMDLKCSHYVVWYSASRKDLVRKRVDDEETFFAVMTDCLKDMIAKTDADLFELYEGKFRGEAYLHSLYCPSGDMISVDRGEPVEVDRLRDEIVLN